MVKRPSTPSYASPVTLAKQLLARAAAGIPASSGALRTAQRILVLPTSVVLDLENARAPYRVARWVAWGKTPMDLQRRADLATHLRKARPGKGWPDARHLAVAYETYRRLNPSREDLFLSAASVPLGQYTAAIDALPKPERRRPEPKTAARIDEHAVLRAVVAARPPRRVPAPLIKLRTTPLDEGDTEEAAEILSTKVKRLEAEIAYLSGKLSLGAQEAKMSLDTLRHENARLTTKINHLEEMRRYAPSDAPAPSLTTPLLTAAGGVLMGFLGRGIAMKKGEEEAPMPSEAPPATAPKATSTVPSTIDGEALLVHVLPVLDNVARAQQHAREGAPVASIAEGLRLVLEAFDAALARNGIVKIPAVGERFNPAHHEAVEHALAPAPAGRVLRELHPGYAAGGRMLRPARVVVSKLAEEPAPSAAATAPGGTEGGVMDPAEGARLLALLKSMAQGVRG